MRMLLVVLFFCVGVFAQEEIGIPYIPKNTGQIDSAVLAPDGKSFYTLKGKVVTQWQLYPITKLGSFETSIQSINKWDVINMHITSDQRRMIIHSKNEIQLWDLETKRLIREKKIKIISGLMNKMVFISIDKNRIIKMWDTTNLDKIKSIELINPCSLVDTSGDEHKCQEQPTHLMLIQDRIICFGTFSLLILDARTLEIINDIWTNGQLYASYNHDLFYYKDSKEKKLAISTGEVKIIENGWIKKNRKQILKYFTNKIIYTSSSFESLTLAHNPYIATPSSEIDQRYSFYNNRTKKWLSTFLQFENFEWIMITSDGHFEMSLNARKYLMMKIHSNEVVSINDTTYSKYYKKINLKELENGKR